MLHYLLYRQGLHIYKLTLIKFIPIYTLVTHTVSFITMPFNSYREILENIKEVWHNTLSSPSQTIHKIYMELSQATLNKPNSL